MTQFVFEFILVGLVGGLLGIFYRNCLWVKKSEMYCDIDGGHTPNIWHRFLGFIAYPLGFCIYCSTTWITFFLCAFWY